MLTNSELRAEAEAARDAGLMSPLKLMMYRDAVSDPKVVIRLLDEIDRLKERNGNLSRKLNRAYAERDAANGVITNLTDRNN